MSGLACFSAFYDFEISFILMCHFSDIVLYKLFPLVVFNIIFFNFMKCRDFVEDINMYLSIPIYLYNDDDDCLSIFMGVLTMQRNRRH